MAVTKKFPYIKHNLSIACYSLLSNSAWCDDVHFENPWTFNIGLLSYSEKDARASALAPIFQGRKSLGNDEYFTITASFDAVSGASPIGAMPSSQIQTLTRASGGNFRVQSGKIPMDQFYDKRYQIGLELEKVLNDTTKANFSAGYSKEIDYDSSSLSALFSKDYNHRNTTLTAGISYQFDHIAPGFGIPNPLMEVTAENTGKGTTAHRKQYDILLGLTQVLNRRTIIQLNYSYSTSEGYHTDHTKVISIVDDQAGPNQGEPFQTIFEKRPEYRKMRNLFGKIKHHLANNIIGFSYRYLSDDWGIHSRTYDFRYTIPSSQKNGRYWEPHIRYYNQSAANFYYTNLPNSLTMPVYASADFRIGDMISYTLGFKYSLPIEDEKRISIRLEHMHQFMDASPNSQMGILNNYKIIPSTHANIAQLEYSF